MDTITHGITGALVAKSFFSEREGRIATAAITLGAIFPDSDTFANFFITNELARLQIHRGITHSLVALPFFAFLLGSLACLWTRRQPRSTKRPTLRVVERGRQWLRYSAFFGLGIGVHILLDVITSFGTQVWTPLSNARAAWDLTFIIDFIFTAIVLLPQLAAWVYSDRRRAWLRGVVVWFALTAVGVAVGWLANRLQIPLSLWTVAVVSLLLGMLLWLPGASAVGFRWPRSFYCRIGVAALVLYLGLCAIAHQAALAKVQDFASRSGAVVLRLAALPAPLSLVNWSGLVETPEGVYRIPIDLSDTHVAAHHFFAQAEQNRYLETAAGLDDVRIYLWFARFPWVTYRQDEGLHIVEYRDIQFYGPFRNDNSPFTLRLLFDDQGRLARPVTLGP
ncbi:MAG: metal-dependent hydrolase [Acidobacteria bacterium]|nr:metal-dependent hydrolase [Acidobacteriota bacterium]